MENNNYVNHAAKYAFFYLLSLVALIFMAFSAGEIIFQIINKHIIDVINSYNHNYISSALRFAISALVISAPIFFLITRQIHKYLYSGELGKDSGIRKWLSYFILLVSSIIIIGWLIGTLNSFLNGELSMKFLLKAITALGISAAVFSFYLYDIKRKEVEGRRDKIIKIYGSISLAFILLVFVGAILTVESPREIRNQKLDNMVINDFEKISGAIDDYYRAEEKMPENLQALKDEFNYISEETLRNPESKQIYGYSLKGEKKYVLCSKFYSGTTDEINEYRYYKDRWPHEAGDQCIEQKINNNIK